MQKKKSRKLNQKKKFTNESRQLKRGISNSKPEDSSGKIIFEDPILCS